MADNDNSSGDSKNKEPIIAEAIKKVFTAGVTAAFMTEEHVRSYLQDLKLPKEILNVLLQGAQKTKDEVAQKVTQEAVQMLKKIDFPKEFSKFAENHKFKISAEIEIVPKNKIEKE